MDCLASCYSCLLMDLHRGVLGQRRHGAISSLQYIRLVTILQHSDSFFLFVVPARARFASPRHLFPRFAFVPNPGGSRMELTAPLSLWFITSRCGCTLRARGEAPHFTSIPQIDGAESIRPPLSWPRYLLALRMMAISISSCDNGQRVYWCARDGSVPMRRGHSSGDRLC